MDEIQATALARVSETDAVRGKFKQKIDEIKAIEEDTIGLHEDMEELDEIQMKGTPSKLGKENKVEDASKNGYSCGAKPNYFRCGLVEAL